MKALLLLCETREARPTSGEPSLSIFLAHSETCDTFVHRPCCHSGSLSTIILDHSPDHSRLFGTRLRGGNESEYYQLQSVATSIRTASGIPRHPDAAPRACQAEATTPIAYPARGMFLWRSSSNMNIL